ncbi:SDR family oxidoreductase [Mangrovihabitans endophyticus]|uniref:3-oxoacyl-ACP reductase n=1 Tax=Mangrovihabitans endophyticus TaxID=1751298 RepID=A0A8J3C0S2_9ACTN|nr:SDR family oxidoreductase [Mangrovihabitans endophyticus]GGK91700.1 3-oxoacyl-ACP reductase [Mangrovihabitans endophyticus]
MMLQGRTALVTGGSRGIGAAVVRRLAAHGARVVFTYRDRRDKATELAAELDGAAVPVRADQAAVSAVDDMFAPVRDGLDIFVSNAAINPRGAISDLTADDFDHVMAVNAKIPLLAMGRAATLMRDNGRIVAVSTVNTVLPAASHALYAASKAALEQFTKVAAREFGARGITVNTVSPGATRTDLFTSLNPPEAAGLAAAVTALGRLGDPDDVAAVVALLASPDAHWITGQNIRACGGYLL